MITCKKCEFEYTGNYCPQCGTPHTLRRINGRYIISELGRVLNFDRGILYTTRELLIRPGSSVRNFIKEDRNRLVKPVLFLLLCSLIYTLTQEIFHFEDGYITTSGTDDFPAAKAFAWIQNHYGYANLMMGVFIGLFVKLMFRKSPYNIFEIFILIFFVME